MSKRHDKHEALLQTAKEKKEPWDSKVGGYQKCAYTHAPLVFANGLTIYGGSASDPKHECDVYVCLDGFAKPYCRYPWDGGTLVTYNITDMQAPSNPESFKKMITWIADQLRIGRSVHVGCMGGHGRTGMVLSALVKEIDGTVDATTYVREHYCKKAVETDSQTEFLYKHFGIKKVKATKESYTSYSKESYDKKDTWLKPSTVGYATSFNEKYAGTGSTGYDKQEKLYVLEPVECKGSIWGAGVKVVTV